MTKVSGRAVTAFSRAVVAILEESGIDGVQVGTATERNSNQKGFEVSISVGIAGQLHGFMFLEASRASATNQATQLGTALGVPLENPTEFGPMHKAVLSELANQVSGRASMYLSDLGVEVFITPPTVVTGRSVHMAISDHLDVHEVPITAPAVSWSLVVGVRAN